jgi:hypothetical protein
LTLASPLWQVPGVPLTRHGLNREFAWEAHDGPFRRITPAQAAAYDEAGFFVLEDAFVPGLSPVGDRAGIEAWQPIASSVTPIAWPRAAGDLPEPPPPLAERLWGWPPSRQSGVR